MASYCCFNCPSKNYDEKELHDKCPNCSRRYDFELEHAPEKIAEYKNIRKLSRGFYAATFVGQRGSFSDSEYVLKVSPKKLYDFFNKDFANECELHRRAAVGTEHIVDILDYFEAEIDFAGEKVPCHVAVLEKVDGVELEKFIENQNPIPIRSIAQIAIDLHYILAELEHKSVVHNDLHAGNVLVDQLPADTRRKDAIDETIRAVAVDLGSLADQTKSDGGELRLGDIHQVAHVLRRLVKDAMKAPDQYSSEDFRLLTVLDTQASLLSPPSRGARVEDPATLARRIIDTFHGPSNEWKQPLHLRQFHEYYNAQHLESWFVPHLMVDPNKNEDEKWIARISGPGPLIVTGMRGCGKTMILRAADFHAQAIAMGESVSAEGLKASGYIGLYASCTRLLDTESAQKQLDRVPFVRLLMQYVRKAIAAVRHASDIDNNAVNPQAYRELADVLSDTIEYDGSWDGCASLEELDRLLLKLIIDNINGSNICRSQTEQPLFAFERLALAVRRCSHIWENSRVLFLLDDVSTRYLSQEMVKDVLSKVLFHNEYCAFKITTEAQTLEFAIYAMGGAEKGRVGRDYEVFDLGASVYEITGNRNKAKAIEFLESILLQRAKFHRGSNINWTPRHVLGDTSLEEIGRNIGRAFGNKGKQTSRGKLRKGIYHGISALAGVCVGDIGDVIRIYDLILRRANGGLSRPPVSPEVQSECYQQFFSGLMFDLNRRDPRMKDFALTFAAASHRLLLDSYKKVMAKREKRGRLRQYTKIYVRITEDDPEWQFAELRKLVDAGVFVLQGGSQAPRVKGHDADPINQFILTFRKLYGVSKLMGLAGSDRFELSGENLQEWLRHPERGEEILLRNLAVDNEVDDFVSMADRQKTADIKNTQSKVGSKSLQPELLFGENVPEEVEEDVDIFDFSVLSDRIQIQQVDLANMENIKFSTTIFGLGFEERTSASVERIAPSLNAHRHLLIRYVIEGRTKAIQESLSNVAGRKSIVKYADALLKPIELSGVPMIDITGLTKPLIFRYVSEALRQCGEVWVAHTLATTYYPSDADIKEVLQAQKGGDYTKLTEKLSKVLAGEIGPYRLFPLMEIDEDPSRRRMLCAFASPKHERLHSLLSERE